MHTKMRLSGRWDRRVQNGHRQYWGRGTLYRQPRSGGDVNPIINFDRGDASPTWILGVFIEFGPERVKAFLKAVYCQVEIRRVKVSNAVL